VEFVVMEIQTIVKAEEIVVTAVTEEIALSAVPAVMVVLGSKTVK